MSRPFKWHVSPRLSNAMEQIANLKKDVSTSNFSMLNSLAKSHINSVCTDCDKSENARVCAKWQWNALDWCYCIALPASPVVQSSNTVSCVSLLFRTYPCVLSILTDKASTNLGVTKFPCPLRVWKTGTYSFWYIIYIFVGCEMRDVHPWKPTMLQCIHQLVLKILKLLISTTYICITHFTISSRLHV